MNGKTRFRILLVDDDARLRELLSRYLLEQGFAVKAVGDASMMDRALHREHFDLMVLEINRPGSAGPGMLRLTRQRLPNQKVMIVSRLLTLRQKHEVDRLGVAMIVTEELSGSELLKRIESVLAAP